LNRGNGLADDLDNEIGLREHDDVAAVGFDGRRIHALRQKTLKFRVHRLVLFSEDDQLGFDFQATSSSFCCSSRSAAGG
jgi:hypothetical protein